MQAVGTTRESDLDPSPGLALAERGTGRAAWQVWIVPFVLVVAALALTIPRVGTPNEYVFDELYYAYTAEKYVAGDDDAYRCCRPPRSRPAIEWTHPPVAKLLIASGIAFFGDNAFGWRTASVLFGAIGVVLTYFLAQTLTGSPAVAAVAGGLLLLDGLYFVESRTGMSNLFLLVFANAALLAFANVLNSRPGRAGGPLLATGVLLGLAVATKWSAIVLLGLVGLLYGARGLHAARGSPAGLRDYFLRGAVCLALVPVAIYLLSYAHFFAIGHGWADLVSLHRSMLKYHRELGVIHAYSSSWWEWPLAARPVWYYGTPSPEGGAFVFANGNPLLYWPMVVAVGWVVIDWWGRNWSALAILAVGFFGQWLPWALSPRGTFIYHFLPAVPLGCVALAAIMVGAWRHGRWQKPAAAVYGVAVLLIFAYFFPMYVAMSLTPEEVAARMWFGSWR